MTKTAAIKEARVLETPYASDNFSRGRILNRSELKIYVAIRALEILDYQAEADELYANGYIQETVDRYIGWSVEKIVADVIATKKRIDDMTSPAAF